MVFPKIKIYWRLIAEVFLMVITAVIFTGAIFGAYFLGLIQGYTLGQSNAGTEFLNYLQKIPPFRTVLTPPAGGPTQTFQPEVDQPLTVTPAPPSSVNWGGIELWGAVNKRRTELGVNPLESRSELCTIASIRLNELLELGKLDGHEGFSNLGERREDLIWIFDKYSNISEFLALGGQTPQETVSLWENTLGHSKLLTGGEYVWGCIYAQNTFAVAITAF